MLAKFEVGADLAENVDIVQSKALLRAHPATVGLSVEAFGVTRIFATLAAMVLFALVPSTVLDAADSKKSAAYVSAFGGISFPTSDSGVDVDHAIDDLAQHYYFHAPSDNTGGLAGVAAGYRFNDNIRLEAEVNRRSNSTPHGAEVETCDSCHADLDTNRSSWGAMINVFYDIPNSSPFTPYLGVGGGWTWDKYNVDCTEVGGSPYCAAGASGERSFSTNGPSAQVMLGVNHQLSDHVTIGVEGRFFADFSSGQSNKFDGGGSQIDFDPKYQALDLLLRLQIDLQ